MQRARRLLWSWCGVGLVAALAACGDDGEGARAVDASELDQGGEIDVADTTTLELGPELVDDASPEADVDTIGDASPEADVDDTIDDASPEADDDTSADTTPEPLPGFGSISGSCGFISAELANPEPSLWHNRIDFGDDPYDDDDIDRLSDGAREILADGNAGGSSILSEVFAFELLARCEGATLLKTENEIVYDVAAKITDMIVAIDDHKVGANPTRAIGFPFDAPYTVEQARAILEKKLGDINSSSAAVAEEDRWVKQVLTVFAYADEHAARVEEAWHGIDPGLRADTIVVVTVTDGEDRFIYSND